MHPCISQKAPKGANDMAAENWHHGQGLGSLIEALSLEAAFQWSKMWLLGVLGQEKVSLGDFSREGNVGA